MQPCLINACALPPGIRNYPVLPRRLLGDRPRLQVARRAHEGPIPGIKWVAGKNMRYITDPAAAASTLELVGIDPYAERKMLGFGDLEKAAKAVGQKLNDLIGKYIDKRAGNPVLVSDEDPRPAYNAAAEDFKDELANNT